MRKKASILSFGAAWIVVALGHPACALDPLDDAPAGSSGSGGGAFGGSETGATGGTAEPIAGEGGNAQSGGDPNGGSGNVGATGSGGIASPGGDAGNTGAPSGEAGPSGGAGGVTGSGGTASGAGAEPGSGGSAGALPATCGNGLFDSGEECEDGDDTPGDGCSPTCLVESGWSCSRDALSVCNPTYPSCAELAGDECAGESCCESLPVPGGSFTQGHAAGEAFEATVSGFRLDKYEVSVARFRAFVGGYTAWVAAGNPRERAGEHPVIAGSGWSSAWPLPSDTDALRDGILSDCISDPTWAGSAGSDGLPANCIDWYSAFLFCIWDGGRLPTESEWEYAAVGGSNESLYAWGDEPVLTGQKDGGEAYAVYNCLGDGSDADICDRADIQPVGSRPDGAGRWEHLDLNGSIAEWAFDWAGDYPFADQTNYANLEETFERVRRGGGWSYDANLVTSVVRAGIEPASHDVRAGIRCARSL